MTTTRLILTVIRAPMARKLSITASTGAAQGLLVAKTPLHVNQKPKLFHRQASRIELEVTVNVNWARYPSEMALMSESFLTTNGEGTHLVAHSDRDFHPANSTHSRAYTKPLTRWLFFTCRHRVY